MKSFVIFLLFVALGAFANGHEKPPAPSTPPTSTSAAQSGSASAANAGAISVSSSSNQLSSASNSSASTGDSSASSNSGGNSVHSSTVYKQEKQAPGVFNSAGYTTAQCQGDFRIGLSAGIGGAGIGKSYSIRDCYLAKAADDEFDRGNLSAAIKLRCAISYYKKVLGSDCEALLNTQTKVDPSLATKEYVDKAFKAAVSK